MDRHSLKQLSDQVEELLRHGSPSCIRQAKSIMIENFSSVVYFTLDLTKPEPKPKHTIADNYPAGGLTATEPCMFCEDYERLTQYRDYVNTKVDKGEMPYSYSAWNEIVEALAKELEQVVKESPTKSNGVDNVHQEGTAETQTTD